MKKRFGLLGLLVLSAVYRSWVVHPSGADVYLLYLPGLVFLLFPIFFLFLCRDRARGSFGLVVLSVFICGLWISPVRWNRQEEGELSVATCNVQGYETDLGRALGDLSSLKPDFLCLQEVWTRKQLEKVVQAFPDYQLVGHPEDDDVETHFNWGTFVGVAPGWSVRRLHSSDQTAAVLVERGSEKLLVVSYHGLKNYNYGPLSMLSTSERQTVQAQGIRDLMARNPEYAVLVAGDFNAPMSGPALKVLDLSDSFKARGRGLGMTFPAEFPILDLDRVLGRKVSFRSFRALDVGSDHLALSARFDI